ncbi:MAG TPA: glutamyl-tRNA reductase [Pseudolysinimonas sp.]|nr:glutamyl-tRNA reductase [Pseudolysinimonas sp.]
MTAHHRNTDFDVLDRVSRGVSTTAADLVADVDFVRGAIVLATCNRFEAYLEVDEPLTAASALATEAVFAKLATTVGADADELRTHASVLTGDEVVRHLFAVSAGLESMVVGEDEISGQVQRALVAARAEGTSSSGLEQLFQRAARTSRRVRSMADLGGAGRSLARLALDLTSTRITDWRSARVLVVGTGRYAATTIAALHDRGARDIRVFSATGRAERFAIKYGARAESELSAAVADAEVIITCTARYTITVDDIPKPDVAEAPRRIIVDLGLPRNVEPAVGALPGVELLDLEVLALHAPLPQLEPGARDLVGSAAQEFLAESVAAPGIVALRTHVFDALDAEIARARGRAANSAEAARTEQALRHLAGVLLHAPSVRGREFAQAGRTEEFVAALEALYGIRLPAEPRSIAPDRPAANNGQGTASA